MPEMLFGNNELLLSYDPSMAPEDQSLVADGPSRVSRDFSGLRLCFETQGALRSVGTGEGWEEVHGGAVQVSMAEKWNRSK